MTQIVISFTWRYTCTFLKNVMQNICFFIFNILDDIQKK